VADDHVFLGQRGEPFTPSALRRRIADLARRAGGEATPHTLRHTFGKRLVDSSVSLEKVAALMGHTNLNTTQLYIARVNTTWNGRWKCWNEPFTAWEERDEYTFRRLAEWERNNLPDKSTSDWPGWIQYIGPPPWKVRPN